jgi:hypothetical protein
MCSRWYDGTIVSIIRLKENALGETLMKSSDPRQTIKELLAEDTDEKSFSGSCYNLVKTCGMKRVEDVEIALQAGTNLIG